MSGVTTQGAEPSGPMFFDNHSIMRIYPKRIPELLDHVISVLENVTKNRDDWVRDKHTKQEEIFHRQEKGEEELSISLKDIPTEDRFAARTTYVYKCVQEYDNEIKEWNQHIEADEILSRADWFINTDVLVVCAQYHHDNMINPDPEFRPQPEKVGKIENLIEQCKKVIEGTKDHETLKATKDKRLKVSSRYSTLENPKDLVNMLLKAQGKLPGGGKSAN